MRTEIRLAHIPDDQYSDYRYHVIFKAYKWDPQVGDQNTIAKHAVLLDRQTAGQLEAWAEQLSAETMQMEEALVRRPSLAKKLGLPKKILKAAERLSDDERSKNVRLMRFDFHPTTSGWAVSEVNSDVPGGLAEASVLPALANVFFEGYEPRGDVANSLIQAFSRRIGKGGTIAFVHATSYADDRQVMEFLGDCFEGQGYKTVFAAPDHLVWRGNKAFSLLEGREGPVDGIVRFFPLEWFVNLPRKSDWRGYFGSETPSCNSAVAIFTQSKRLPLVWDELGIPISAWKKLLPETKSPKAVKPGDMDWIFKPALGRVGGGISIWEAITEKEKKAILKEVRHWPGDWVAQRRFESRPVKDEQGQSWHLCVGVFTVDGKSAGFYGRMSPYPRIDERAQDVPILVAKGGDQNAG